MCCLNNSFQYNKDVAKRFAGKEGVVYEAYIPQSELLK